jgi:hypothetical protein
MKKNSWNSYQQHITEFPRGKKDYYSDYFDHKEELKGKLKKYLL